jgi:hypothetical protein
MKTFFFLAPPNIFATFTVYLHICSHHHSQTVKPKTSLRKHLAELRRKIKKKGALYEVTFRCDLSFKHYQTLCIHKEPIIKLTILLKHNLLKSFYFSLSTVIFVFSQWFIHFWVGG